ncbi:MAG: CDP-alcohol phosphatidyltransferase family protein [Pseudohongiellaceae bacterium]
MIANCLTGLRLLLAVPTALAFARPGLISPVLLLVLLSVAIITDVLDGIVARKSGTASAAGQLFDHTTDFLFVTSCLAGAAIAGQLTFWLPVLIVVAFSQYLLDSRFLHRQKQLRMSFIGRWNGILYFVPLVVLALGRLEFLGAFAVFLTEAVSWLAWILLVSTLISIADRALARTRQPRSPQAEAELP